MRHRLRYFLLRVLPTPVLVLAQSLRLLIGGDYLKLRRRLEGNELAVRRATAMLFQRYPAFAETYHFKNRINQHEATVYSQNGEDGILLFIFTEIGIANRRFVEFGIGDGRQCNTALLSIHSNWTGLLMEGEAEKAKVAQAYYKQALKSRAGNLRVEAAHVTRENVNELFVRFGVRGEIDLLSIDVDGNDYWIWEAVQAIRPRVVVIEYNASLGAERSLTIPYDPNFNALRAHPSGYYHGASLPALAKLGKRKGYALIGCESAGVNAFFVRATELPSTLETLSPQKAYCPHARRSRKGDTSDQMKIIQHLDLREV